jgi:hypothetical protein
MKVGEYHTKAKLVADFILEEFQFGVVRSEALCVRYWDEG